LVRAKPRSTTRSHGSAGCCAKRTASLGKLTPSAIGCKQRKLEIALSNLETPRRLACSKTRRRPARDLRNLRGLRGARATRAAGTRPAVAMIAWRRPGAPPPLEDCVAGSYYPAARSAPPRSEPLLLFAQQTARCPRAQSSDASSMPGASRRSNSTPSLVT
jgi:hypothetical protein